MRRRPLIALAAACAAGTSIAIIPTTAAAAAPPTTTLAGSAAPVTAGNPGIGPVSGAQTHTIQLWMAGNEPAAQQFVDAVSTPGSPTYRQFVSPGAYTQQFGPSPDQVQAVESFLTGAGFSDVQASANDDYVSATGSVATIDSAFTTQMRRYRNTAAGGPATIEANDSDLSVPSSIAADVLTITGVDTTPPQPAEPMAGGPTAGASGQGCSRYWAQKTRPVSPAFDGITKAAVHVCGYSAAQVQAAYGMTPANTGTGKTIALIEIGAPTDMFATLTDYANANGLPAPASTQLRQLVIGQGGACGNDANYEEQLDSEAAYAMAPGATQLMVEGDSCDTQQDGLQGVFDAELAPLTGNGSSASAAIESASFVIGGDGYLPASTLKASHAIALRAAAEGVSLLFSSGDGPYTYEQATDPDVTAVGGTTLGIGAADERVFETGWSDDIGHRKDNAGPWTDEGVGDGSGGGASVDWPEPAYQQGVVPSSMSQNTDGTAGRTVPDIAADSDPASGMLFGLINTNPKTGATTPYTTFVGSGTSQSAPLVAGMVADAEQGQPDFGFLNPTLYSLATSGAFHDILPVTPSQPQVDRAAYATYSYLVKEPNGDYLIEDKPCLGVFDTQDPSQTDLVTAPGYDTMTGLGTPNGAAFINALRSGGQASVNSDTRR